MPGHQNKTSISVNKYTLSAKIFQSDSKIIRGDIATLVMHLKNLSFPQSNKYIHGILGLKYKAKFRKDKEEPQKINPLDIFRKIKNRRNLINAYDLDIFGETKYFGKIYKDRTGVTKKGDIVSNPNFEIWKDKWESTKKYGVKKGVDLSQDVEKDRGVMVLEDDKLDKLREDFKAKVKLITKSNQPKVMKKAKEIGIENPLKAVDVKLLEQLVKYIDTLE